MLDSAESRTHLTERVPPVLPRPAHPIDLAIVVPTYNERGNVPELIARLQRVLRGFEWELIFVDDDSPDGTSDLIREYAACDRRVRLLHRIGRRGLSSACIEGMLATPAQSIAVMDADLQHDETILPEMVDRLRTENLDVVVATRNGEGGCMGDFAPARVRLSSLGRNLSRFVCRCNVSDPMSGFFVVSRAYFRGVVERLQEGGFKILVDMLASSDRPVRLGEVGYRFRNRTWGDSKLDANAAVECLFLIVNKLLGGFVPSRFAAFALVGASGLAVHLGCLAFLFRAEHVGFDASQVLATYVAMTINFFLNNLITYYDRRLRGARMWTALAMFWIACSFGVLANVSSAHSLLRWHMPWYLAGLAGAAVSSVWNYAANQILTWRHRHPYSSSPSPSLRGSFHFTLSPAEIVQSQIETLPKENEEQVVA
ncbi:MAG TPA: glycosyltransferase family 2 protein [Terriglobales bacterium]|jgi:dolichol-phosphate mannosyltransferase|nr:glycosyltransferase family 2 protein [Terriglobales bacterium]